MALNLSSARRALFKLRFRQQPLVGAVGLLLQPALRTRTVVLTILVAALLSGLTMFDNGITGAMRPSYVSASLALLRIPSLLASIWLLQENTRRGALLLALPTVSLLAFLEAVAVVMAASDEIHDLFRYTGAL